MASKLGTNRVFEPGIQRQFFLMEQNNFDADEQMEVIFGIVPTWLNIIFV